MDDAKICYGAVKFGFDNQGRITAEECMPIRSGQAPVWSLINDFTVKVIRRGKILVYALSDLYGEVNAVEMPWQDILHLLTWNNSRIERFRSIAGILKGCMEFARREEEARGHTAFELREAQSSMR